jgi:NAD(P)-dependent dehydrogenase (short-subunit alcohol dehydrogenase family)
MFNLAGDVAVITGGNGGVGLAFARGLVKCGGRVAIWARNADKNAAALAELRALGGDVEAFVCDVTDGAEIDAALAATVARFGKVDSCFANAGAAGPVGPSHRMGAEAWASLIDLNLVSVINTFSAVTRHLIERKAPGRLVATSSIAALVGTGGAAGYGTTKAALLGLVRALAVELGRRGIRVNAVLPGYIESEMAQAGTPEFQEGTRRRSAIGRLGTPEDMEGIAVFLASRHSDYMTGQAIVIDGGHTVFPL